jgi:hypothetical protein
LATETEPDELAEIWERLQRLEDERAIQRVVGAYGPYADAGLTTEASSLWLEDGAYDWDAAQGAYQSRDAVDRMLQGASHQRLIAGGVAHLTFPPLCKIEGNRAIAVTYSLVFVRAGDSYQLFRLGANRWELERSGTSWKISRRINRQLDQTGSGRELFRESLSKAPHRWRLAEHQVPEPIDPAPAQRVHDS